MGDFWTTLGTIFWWMFMAYIFVAYLMVVFSIITDLFRDKEMTGWIKAVWIFCLIFFTFITALVYLIVRGRGMSERQAAQAAESRKAAESYLRGLAGGSGPAEELSKAKALLDSGAITASEFASLKAKILA